MLWGGCSSALKEVGQVVQQPEGRWFESPAHPAGSLLVQDTEPQSDEQVGTCCKALWVVSIKMQVYLASTSLDQYGGSAT